MNRQMFDPSAAFHIANAGITRNVALAGEICAQEKERIRLTNEIERVPLLRRREVLLRERSELQSALALTPRIAAQPHTWPVWYAIMAAIFTLGGLGFTRLCFDSFGFESSVRWLLSVSAACLFAFATAYLLERTDVKPLFLGISITLFALSLGGVVTLALVRGDLFLLHLQNLAAGGDKGSDEAVKNALAFYAATAPKMRLFLTLLSVALETAAGLAIHEVRVVMKSRRPRVSPESQRLLVVEHEIGETETQIIFLQNEPETFECEFRRNLMLGLLDGVARHTGVSRNVWASLALVVVLGSGTILRGQAIDEVEALDYSATSKAMTYDGHAAHAENIAAAARIIEHLPQGSRFTVSAISDQSFARPFLLLSGTIPDNPGPLKEYDEIIAARHRLAAMLRTIAAATAPNYPSTDILGFLMAAGITFHNTPHMRHVLVLHSDMRQSARPLDIEHIPAVAVSAALGTVAREHLFADLTGVEVYIYGVHAVGKDVRYWQSLRDFWAAYFERCHANLRAFSMTRENPDFSESR